MIIADGRCRNIMKIHWHGKDVYKRQDVDIHVRIPTEPTAAIASLPILPTQAMSVRLYAICMNEVAIMGTFFVQRKVKIRVIQIPFLYRPLRIDRLLPNDRVQTAGALSVHRLSLIHISTIPAVPAPFCAAARCCTSPSAART